MRKIRKVIADSDISYYDRSGELKTFHTVGKINTVAKAINTLMVAGIVNVLIDDITVHKTVYVMDVNTFISHAERIDTDTDTDTDTDIDNDNEPEF